MVLTAIQASTVIALTVFAVLALSACGGGETYDVVLHGGRVLDPETGMDAVRNVGIRDGVIAAVSEDDLLGTESVDVSGLVVAPGFVDLHEHGQSEEAYALMVRDGVTSAFELEVGTGDVNGFYSAREGGQIVNYGVAIGHISTRMAVLGDPGDFLPAGIGGSGTASPEQLDEIEARLRVGLDEGAVAMGFGSAYTPGAEMAEIERMMGVAAEYGVSAHIHMRGGVPGLDSTLAAARDAGAPLHVVHVNSSAGDDIREFLEMIQAARDAGQDVTTEAYPYGAGMTRIESALFDDWESWSDERLAEHQWVATGERLTRETFGRYRAQGGGVIIHGRSEEQTRAAITSPLAMVASDGFIENGTGHPRTSGSYSKVLGQYVRDEGAISLMEAIRKMTIEPARRLEARVPSMAGKGRIQVGADADITVFDPETVQDRSTYMDATIPAEGIPFVLVNGRFVVADGEVTAARPGRAIRAAVR
ncbi:MAG: amidohydrolase family protein [Gemmatimonadota bacterium]|nr:amidohydrolase family protein [Gemmatimonadota bacterium]MDH5760389.1 amidohydrolase family protein [Gemmatimonadota bacterium]